MYSGKLPHALVSSSKLSLRKSICHSLWVIVYPSLKMGSNNNVKLYDGFKRKNHFRGDVWSGNVKDKVRERCKKTEKSNKC